MKYKFTDFEYLICILATAKIAFPEKYTVYKYSSDFNRCLVTCIESNFSFIMNTLLCLKNLHFSYSNIETFRGKIYSNSYISEMKKLYLFLLHLKTNENLKTLMVTLYHLSKYSSDDTEIKCKSIVNKLESYILLNRE